MSVISTAMIKELRKRTGAGMMDCKKALLERNGDMDKAVSFLRETDLSAASRKAGRATSEGLVHARVDQEKTVGAMVEVNCETDFVARNESYKMFVRELAKLVAEQDPMALDTLLHLPMTDGRTVDQTVKGLVNRFGENITVRRFVRFHAGATGVVYSYVHDDYLTDGKIGVLMEATVTHPDTLSNLEFNACMNALVLHIAAARPDYVGRDDVSQDVLEREKSVYRTQAIAEGKSASITERIVQGRLNSFYKDCCLLEQSFVKDHERTIAQLLEDLNVKLGGEHISIVRFARFEKGENT